MIPRRRLLLYSSLALFPLSNLGRGEEHEVFVLEVRGLV